VAGSGSRTGGKRQPRVVAARLPVACGALYEGNREALRVFANEEAAQLLALLDRLTANLDRLGGPVEWP
jgi:hypothetical protein